MHSAIATEARDQAARPIGTHHHTSTFPPVVTSPRNQVLFQTVTTLSQIVGIWFEPLSSLCHRPLERD
jgi:hypothetical protein